MFFWGIYLLKNKKSAVIVQVKMYLNQKRHQNLKVYRKYIFAVFCFFYSFCLKVCLLPR
jgi:hypothetical protein